MSEKAAAAQKWAEAKESFDNAAKVLDEAKAAYEAAEHAEHDAWVDLECLSGRSNPDKGSVILKYGDDIQRQPDPFRHSMPVRPLG